MLKFNIVDLGNLNFRCVLGEEVYFDLTVVQTELFGYTSFFGMLKGCVDRPIYTILGDERVGEVAAVRFSKEEDSIWILARNGIHGAFYKKSLGG